MIATSASTRWSDPSIAAMTFLRPPMRETPVGIVCPVTWTIPSGTTATTSGSSRRARFWWASSFAAKPWILLKLRSALTPSRLPTLSTTAAVSESVRSITMNRSVASGAPLGSAAGSTSGVTAGSPGGLAGGSAAVAGTTTGMARTMANSRAATGRCMQSTMPADPADAYGTLVPPGVAMASGARIALSRVYGPRSATDDERVGPDLPVGSRPRRRDQDRVRAAGREMRREDESAARGRARREVDRGREAAVDVDTHAAAPRASRRDDGHVVPGEGQ